jgi:hypothetical protein
MFLSEISPEADQPAAPPDPAQDRAARQLCVLERITARAERMTAVLEARLLRQVKRDPAPEDQATADAGIGVTCLAFDRISRTIRRTWPWKPRSPRRPWPPNCSAARATERQQIVFERKTEVRASMVEAIEEGQDRPKAETERLLDDLDDWIERQDDTAFEAGPIGKIVWEACRQLGLPMDLDLWESSDWRENERYERPPGSPFTAWRNHPRPLPARGRGADQRALQ